MKTAMKTLLLAAVATSAFLSSSAAIVPYVDEHGASMDPASCTVVTDATTTMSNGWYAVTTDATVAGRIEVSGDVHVILCDGQVLTANAGITVPAGSSLTIWGQGGIHAVPGTAETTLGTGALVARTPASGDHHQAAAIGGEKTGTTGQIAINGGVVTAHGIWGAGIGGGDVAASSGSVTIRGGHVDASGQYGSAGIGSGAYAGGCDVTISGGYVVAAGSVYASTGQAASGIGTGRPRPGGSNHLSSGVITITGGTVVASAGVPDGNGSHPSGAQAIGVNNVDAEYNGTDRLVLGEVRAYASENGEAVAASNRVDACHSAWVKLEPCPHLYDDNGICLWCGTRFVPPVVDIFVDAGMGDDAHDGLAPTSAVRSIQRAIDISQPGATIFVAAGIYGPVDVGGKTLTIIGAGAASAVIDAAGWGLCALLSDGTTLRGFTLRNGWSGADGGTLEDCIVENCTDGNALAGTDTVRCIVRNCSHTDNRVIHGGIHRNTLFHGLSGHTIIGDSTLYNCTVANTVADLVREEVYRAGNYYFYTYPGELFQGGSRFNCIVWDNARNDAWFEEPDDPVCLTGWRPCPENDADDPAFLAPERGNYRLREESPALDSGDSAYASQAGETDLDGRPRIQGTVIDRGCYEGVAGVVVTAAAVGCGTVSPVSISLNAPGTATFTAHAAGWNRPVVGWYTNGVLAASSGDTFTVYDVTEDTVVTVRFAVADWYVDAASGDDANEGLSPGTAFRTVQRALTAALRDDTVHLAAGTYGPVNDHGGRFSVVGAGAGATIVDGGGTNRCATLMGGTTLRHLTLRNGGDNECGGARGGLLEDCVVENCGGDSAMLRDAGTLRCIVRNCSVGGDVVSGGTHRNSLFHGLAGNCVFRSTTFCNCTVADSAGWESFEEDVIARNCIFWGNSSEDGAVCNDAEDPLFANVPACDYRVRTESPAIDAGDPAFAAEAGETDLAGNPRVQGAAIDRGCHEGGVEGLVRFTAKVVGFGGTVSPTFVQTNAPATVTFTLESAGSFARPIAGWYTNGVLAAGAGYTFTLTDVANDIDVTIRFEPTDLYVDAVAGDDANDGLSPATALRTFAAAIAIAASGDTIHAAAGTHAPVDTRERTVSIVGAGAASTVIDGASGRCAILSGGATLTGFTLRNGSATDNDDAVVKYGGLVDCIVEDCHVDSPYAHLLCDVGTLRCIVRRCASAAVYGTIRGGTHRNTLFHSLSGEGWFFYSATVLYNCTFADNSARNLMTGGIFPNCILWGNSSWNGDVCNDAEDPRFADAAGGDYRLRASSPAIDAGEAAYAGEAGETDLAGNARVQGSAIDRGCYEFPRNNDFLVVAKVEGRGFVSPDSAVVTNPAESVMFTADTSTWGLPVAGWYTNGVMAAGAQNQFLLENICEDTVVTVKFQPGNACIYVDAAAGRNSNDGASPARALQTIQRAIDVSISNDTIRVAAGSYEPIDVGGRVLTIIGDGADTTAIDGGGRNQCAILAEGTTLRGFTLRNGYAYELLFFTYPWDGTIASVENGALEDCIIENCVGERDAAILFGTSTSRCIVRNCHAKEFIALYGTHRSSLFYGNRSEVLEILDYAESYNCTFADNSTEFPYIVGGTVVNAVRWGNSTTMVGEVGVPSQNDPADPMFVDAANGNYRLRSGSPAINSGDASYASQAGTTDLDGNPRVQGGNIDRGCYESPAATSGYSYWAWMWGLGAWDATDANGVPNVFRYAFDKPTGAFTDPFLLGISFDSNDKAVITTPPLVNTEGFTFSILATDTPDGTDASATYPLDASGETTIDETGKTKRFFRLKAKEK